VRVSRLASEYPFESIIGIEFSRELAEIAQKNITTYRNANQVCRGIRVVAADAAAFELPNVPLVAFFYNPFDAVTMRQVIEHLDRSLQQFPRPVSVFYYTPDHGAMFATIPGLRKHLSQPEFCIDDSIAD
jgi:hypothetical protein